MVAEVAGAAAGNPAGAFHRQHIWTVPRADGGAQSLRQTGPRPSGMRTRSVTMTLCP